MSSRPRGSEVSRGLDYSKLLLSSPLPKDRLPTHGDCIRLANQIREDSNKKLSIADVSKKVRAELISAWSDVSHHFRPPVIKEAKNVLNEVKKILETAGKIKHLEGRAEKLEELVYKEDVLLDLTRCR